MFMNAVINAFVMTTDYDQMRPRREFAGKTLGELATVWGHEHDETVLTPERFHRRENRLWFHDHSLTATKWCVIHDAMLVGRPLAQVVDPQVERAAFLRPLHHAFRKRGATDFWEKRQDIDAHGEG